MKLFILLFPCIALLCSGCAVENLDPASVRPSSSPIQPDRMAKPNKQQRGAIMSGEKPDWRVTSEPPAAARK